MPKEFKKIKVDLSNDRYSVTHEKTQYRVWKKPKIDEAVNALFEFEPTEKDKESSLNAHMAALEVVKYQRVGLSPEDGKKFLDSLCKTFTDKQFPRDFYNLIGGAEEKKQITGPLLAACKNAVVLKLRPYLDQLPEKSGFLSSFFQPHTHRDRMEHIIQRVEGAEDIPSIFNIIDDQLVHTPGHVAHRFTGDKINTSAKNNDRFDTASKNPDKPFSGALKDAAKLFGDSLKPSIKKEPEPPASSASP